MYQIEVNGEGDVKRVGELREGGLKMRVINQEMVHLLVKRGLKYDASMFLQLLCVLKQRQSWQIHLHAPNPNPNPNPNPLLPLLLLP